MTPVLLLYVRLPPGASSEDAQRLAGQIVEPALAALDDAPAVRAGLICGGEALRALDSEAPDVLAQLRERVNDGRLEALATALCEPVLGDIAEEDAVNQVQAHLALVRRCLDVRPRGLAVPWLAWSGVAARIADRCDLDWVTIPDEVSGVVSVEHEGSSVRGLGCSRMAVGDPIHGGARWLDLSVLGWHGENERARSEFLQTLGSLARTQLPSEAIDAGLPAPRRVVVGQRAAAAYRHGWPAADLLHQRMIATSTLVARLARESAESEELDVDPVQVVQAQRYLWRAQAGDLFVDADEGGIRSPLQRHRAWKDVLRAERIALEGLRAAHRPGATPVDLDGDGVEEILLRTPEASARIVPAHRGSLASFSVAGIALQVSALPRRTREEWEPTLRVDPADAPEPGATGELAASKIIEQAQRRIAMREALQEDLDARTSLGGRFLHAEASLERFQQGDLGSPTTGLDRPWVVEVAERSGSSARVSLLGQGEYHDGDESWPIDIRKRYTLRGTELELRYEVQNRGLGVLRTRVLLPLDLSLGPDSGAHQIIYRGRRQILDELGDESTVDLVRLVGPKGEVTLRADSGVRLWRYPVQTLHRRRGELELATQGVCMGVVWLLQLWARESAALTLRLDFQPS